LTPNHSVNAILFVLIEGGRLPDIELAEQFGGDQNENGVRLLAYIEPVTSRFDDLLDPFNFI
jgi:hypothetical protein